jgi:hypothetical protein
MNYKEQQLCDEIRWVRRNFIAAYAAENGNVPMRDQNGAVEQHCLEAALELIESGEFFFAG